VLVVNCLFPLFTNVVQCTDVYLLSVLYHVDCTCCITQSPDCSSACCCLDSRHNTHTTICCCVAGCTRARLWSP
jgi:hypothetical protein